MPKKLKSKMHWQTEILKDGAFSAENALNKRKQVKVRRRISSVMGLLVAGLLFFALMKPAITLEKGSGLQNEIQASCGLDEHVHTENCFGYDHEESEPVYALVRELECAFVPHRHDDSCYNAQGTLICGISEEYYHVHDENCYEYGTLVCNLNETIWDEEKNTEEVRVLVCDKPESAGHHHTENCYTTTFFTDAEPICGHLEAGAHIHSDDCYGPVLICEEEHEHTDACYAWGLVCGLEEGSGHVHTLECYPSMKELTCGIDESEGHVHTDDCYALQRVVREPHVHSESCFDNGVLVCGLTEVRSHQHTDDCWHERQVLLSGGHQHNGECAKVLICGQEEHVHTAECYRGSQEENEASVLPVDDAALLTNEESGEVPDADDDLLVSEDAGFADSTADGMLGYPEDEAATGEPSAPEGEYDLAEEDVQWLEDEDHELNTAGAEAQSKNPEQVLENSSEDTALHAEDAGIPSGSENSGASAGKDGSVPEYLSPDVSGQDDPVPDSDSADENAADVSSSDADGVTDSQASDDENNGSQFEELTFVKDLVKTGENLYSVTLNPDEGVLYQDILDLAGIDTDEVQAETDIAFLELGDGYFACRFAFTEGMVILHTGETDIGIHCTYRSEAEGHTEEAASENEEISDSDQQTGTDNTGVLTENTENDSLIDSDGRTDADEPDVLNGEAQQKDSDGQSDIQDQDSQDNQTAGPDMNESDVQTEDAGQAEPGEHADEDGGKESGGETDADAAETQSVETEQKDSEEQNDVQDQEAQEHQADETELNDSDVQTDDVDQEKTDEPADAPDVMNSGSQTEAGVPDDPDGEVQKEASDGQSDVQDQNAQDKQTDETDSNDSAAQTDEAEMDTPDDADQDGLNDPEAEDKDAAGEDSEENAQNGSEEQADGTVLDEEDSNDGEAGLNGSDQDGEAAAGGDAEDSASAIILSGEDIDGLQAFMIPTDVNAIRQAVLDWLDAEAAEEGAVLETEEDTVLSEEGLEAEETEGVDEEYPDKEQDEGKVAGRSLLWKMFAITSEKPFSGTVNVNVPIRTALADLIPEGNTLTSLKYRLFLVTEDASAVMPVETFEVIADDESVKELLFSTSEPGTWAFVAIAEYVPEETSETVESDEETLIDEEPALEDAVQLTLDFSTFDFYAFEEKAGEEPAVETLNPGVAVNFRKIFEDLVFESSDGLYTAAFKGLLVLSSEEALGDITFDKMKVVSSSGSLKYDSGRLNISGNGELELSDGVTLVLVHVVGYDENPEVLDTEKEPLSVGIAQITDGDGEGLPVGTEGHAVISADESSVDRVKEFLNAAQMGRKMRLMAAPKAAPAAAGNETRYLVFDIEACTDSENGFHVAVDLSGNEIIGSGFRLYHVHDDMVEPLEITVHGETLNENTGVQRLQGFEFDTASFSDFVLSYTVDFYWEVNGKTFEFGIPGGGFVSFHDLLEILGIKADDEATETDEIQEFLDGIESVEFSNPELVSVSKAEEDTTVGAIKERLQLECVYSDELTAEQIAAINGQEVRGGDWALISLKPFDTEESLTVIMNNGDMWTVVVTDGQIRKTVMSASGEMYEITVTYDDAAGIPDGSELTVREILPGDKDYEGYYGQAVEKAGSIFAAAPSAETADEAEFLTAGEDGEDFPEEAGHSDASARICKYARIFDIEIRNGDLKIEPASAVTVQIRLLDAPEDSDAVPTVVHFAENGPEIMDASAVDSTGMEVQFTTDSFSVYSVVYTVDFSYSVNGRTYEFNLPGGGFVSFSQLVEVMGIADDAFSGENTAENEENGSASDTEADAETGMEAVPIKLDDVEVSEETRIFVADVESVEFSSPELVWVGKVESGTTVGQLKEDRGLACEYSQELTEEQIESINAQTVEAGDWALISMLPFDTEETLVVTMKTGEVFAVRVTDMQITKKVMTAEGETYMITVTYSAETGIPETADLLVSEITEDSPAAERSYAEYVADAENALGAGAGSAEYIRLFDIKIVDKNNPDISYQPAPGTTVDVKIELDDAMSSALGVVHFADGEDVGDVVENVSVQEKTVLFAAEGFSVYAVVKLDGPAEIKSLAELDSAIEAGKRFNLSVFRESMNQYFTAAQNSNGCYLLTTDLLNASDWTIEKADEGENCYIVYSEGQGYMANTDGNKMGYTTDRGSATVFELTGKNNRFYFKVKGQNKWLQYSNTGGGIRLYTDNKNAANSQIAIMDASETGDPNHLDGNSYGIMLWNGGTTGKAMMAAENTQNSGSLLPKVLTVVTNENNHTDKLYAPSNVADAITDWTFHWNPENRKYRLSANTADGEKYLKISSAGLEMVGENDASEIEVVRGSGNYSDQICLKCNGKTLAYSGNIHDGFGIASNSTAVGNDWLYLVDTKSNNIPEGYGRTYVAEKISVSDASLSVEDHINQYGDPKETLEGKYVIIYTRSWNGSGYDYFAVNGEGKLIPCHENGNVIEWVGTSQDDMLWKFIEYKDASGNVTHYYDLYNEATGNWLAPQLTPEHHLADDPVGLIMSGRRYGEYYTPILAWDHSSYAYSSLKVDRTANNNADDENIVSCRRTDPDSADFYFALVQELNVDDQLHGVPTVDNDLYGISMKMVDLDNKPGDGGYMNAFLGSSDGGVGSILQQGLLSTRLEENGYPNVIKKPGNNLETLFSENGAAKANHLFIESTYRETGYYVYDSTQNFATLRGGTGDFTVYDQLGTHDESSKPTLKHGQFFPYNDLKPGVFSEKNRENLYNIDGVTRLDDDDPRKYEQLYLIENPDYYFGMELEASFEQTPNGLDAWGHDIIFEFSGDDDFWLYVDGELVIDLGGIHSAVSGSVNFRTGDVYVNEQPTTLYNLFLDHYMNRDGMTREEAENKLLHGDADHLPVFTEKDGRYIFTDYSSHTMRIFYFERGASASNLHMKFNLAAVKKGAVQLSKKVENVASASELLFPYQIYYRFANDPDGEYTRLTNSTDSFRSSTDYYKQTYGVPVNLTKYDKDYVFHQGSESAMDFDPYLKIGNHLYEDVFFLSPDKSAEINFPTKGDGDSLERIAEYYIVECGIDPNEYKKVTVNEAAVTGSVVADEPGILDFATSAASPEQRSSVRYVNEAEVPGSLKFTKVIHDPEGHEIPVEEYYEGHPDGTYYESGPTFDFRLYFGSPFDTGANTAAYMYVYRVKDPEGKYCHWNPEKGMFEKITGTGYPYGTDDFGILSDDYYDAERNVTVYGDKTLASFDSSTFGAITKIPPYYTVEVLDLVPGLWYKVIERPTETPDGYRLYRCERDGEEIKEEQWATGIYEDDMTWKGVDGRIESGKKSDVKIGNKEGYGLRVNKTWTDAKTITEREATYFAVYKAVSADGGATTLELVENSVRQMAYTASPDWQTLVWYYDSLPQGGTLEDYWVYEVALTAAENGEISVAQNGVVSGYETCTPVGISEAGAQDSRVPVATDGLTLYGIPAGAETSQAIYYKVTYGESTPYPLANSKVRNFTATNEPKNRPVIRLKKEDWKNGPLAGAAFTLVETESGESVGGSLVSDSTGSFDPELIFLDYGRSYTLTETKSPNGYIGLPQSLTITMPAEPAEGQSEGNVTVSPDTVDISDYYELVQKTETEPPTLTIKNRPYELRVLKADCSTETEPVPLKDAEFKLYKYRTINNVTVPVPVSGFENVKTDSDGYIKNLPTEPGDYALEELMPPSGYEPFGKNDWVYFQISQTGVIGQPTSGVNATLAGPNAVQDNSDGLVEYTIIIPNTPLPMYLKKVDAAGTGLTGAKFSLSRQVLPENPEPEVPGEQSDPVDTPSHPHWQIVDAYSEIDMTAEWQTELSNLPRGLYCLTEVLSPAGYVIFEKNTYFRITDHRAVELTNADGTGANSNTGASIALVQDENGNSVYVITVTNSPGVELPSTGGPGTDLCYIFGILLIALASAGFVMKRKRRNAA